ncbi:LOW QUALITY PROTEIN: sorting nexin-4 [Nilaparvata lugens]|uniref:LOW QUALITY PROTEIN: sorting nexin-4 n=1 Tax=Nilaparvata lugens TaxID=108931 RepID=UPI00193D17D6|nr:LOW QUALITY PROTEIN: sorting nexin-4 [Nilaparvata lugens]
MVWRRYTEFEQLRTYLETIYPWTIVPPLPEKRATFTWENTPSDTFDPDFIDRRRAGLETFLHRVADHPVLCNDPLVVSFLQQEDSWNETIKETGYLQSAESKLKALSVSIRLRNPDKQFEEIKANAVDLQSNLSNVLDIRARLASRRFNMYKMHGAYGKVFSEWSAIEKDMGDGLQKAGHFFDSIAAGIGIALEFEELIADHLKEYLFFALSVQSVCERHEMLQLELEQAEDLVSSRISEKEKAQQGRSSLMSRLFGSVDTEEVRDIKVGQIDQKIHEGEESVRELQLSLSEFSRNASKDIDYFNQRKVTDLKETFSIYVGMQIKMTRKILQTWTNIRDCINSIP